MTSRATSLRQSRVFPLQTVGINSTTKRLNSSISEDELLKIIDDLNKSLDVDGILVQLPLPEHINERKVSLILMISIYDAKVKYLMNKTLGL